ncbi:MULTISPECIES: C4-dicarboxylate TRAP transporter substrate-binding protein [Marinovum]|uniref:C4-dicarboxylate TRAP transporter substrate-binding protein n=1 Tax=Marinovum TaxID=367771 RepID=UPI00237B4E79|nr:C4-dicarboxylate TRAP transporter substrate-binding protein [Marinovum sp. PR37]MDD9746435.1 C4-dicarboxylate TRAP transporter substrate-binding protein [Marinovum sp. PR37]
MKLAPSLKATALTLALSPALVAGAASAKTLNAAIGMGPKNSSVAAYNSFAAYVAEHTDIDIKVFPMSLLSMKETPQGIRDGLADLGFVVPVYFPAQYKESNLVANLSMLATSGVKVPSPGAALSGAMTEYLFNCTECLAEYQNQGQVYLGSVSSHGYDALCTKSIRTLDDLKGAKMRSPGGNYSRWAESMGAVAVSMPAGDTYEAMSQGVIDCHMGSVSDLTNNSLVDVTKYVTFGVPGGAFAGVATSNFNTGVWRDLTEAERAVILRGAARMQAEMTLGYYDLAQKDATGAPAAGVEIVDADAELVAATDAFVQKDLPVIAAQFESDYGVENVEAKIGEMVRLVEKWKGLTKDLPGDVAGLEQVYWDEVFSKLDPSTYGIY